MKTCISLFIGVLLFAGCQSTSHPPKWLSNPKSVYPENRYLVAVGEGDTRRSAENDAAGNLSRIFESRIESTERLFDETHETTTSFNRTSDYSSAVNIKSDQTLYNIQFAEAWQDQKGRIHAIAYLDRRKTADIYREKINKLAAQVHFFIAQAQNERDLLKKYAALRSAVHRSTEVTQLLRQLKTIHSPSVPSTTPSYNPNKIKKELAETARKIRVQIHVQGDEGNRMKTVLEEIITHYGFVIGKSPTLLCSGTVSISDTGQRNANLVFLRYTFVIKLQTTDSTTLLSLHEKGREGHINKPEARIRIFRTLEQTIKPQAIQQLDLYFNKLVAPE